LTNLKIGQNKALPVTLTSRSGCMICIDLPQEGVIQGENNMKINLKFGQKQEPFQTGLPVHTHMLAGSPCEDMCKYWYPPSKKFQNSPGLKKNDHPKFDPCLSSCKEYDRPM
jgi:hypothetical protein